MENYRPRVLLDCDGVICDFSGGYLDVVFNVTGRLYTLQDVTSWNLDEALGLSKDESELCNKALEVGGWWKTLGVYAGAQEGVARLQEIADVYIVTAPWESARTWEYERKCWLKQHFGIPSKLVVPTHAKQIVQGDILIDDKVSNLVTWSKENLGWAVCWDQPWNAREAYVGPRTNDWQQIYDLVSRL